MTARCAVWVSKGIDVVLNFSSSWKYGGGLECTGFARGEPLSPTRLGCFPRKTAFYRVGGGKKGFK